MLFADIRGSTALAEGMKAAEFSRLVNRFYRQSTEALIKTDAYIDKFVGDEVIGFYFPLFAGKNHAAGAVQAAQKILSAAASDRTSGQPLPVGVGVHTGVAYVGTVRGAEDSAMDVTALGDNVNIAARLAGKAGPGEALVSEAAYSAAGLSLGTPEQRCLELKGKSYPVSVRVLTAG